MWRPVLWTLATVLGHLAVRSMSHGDPQWLRLGVPDAIAASSVVASVLLFFYTRRPGRDPRRILDLGLAYMVLTAFDLGLTFHWERMPADSPVTPGISWIGAVVLMFAAIVPSTPVEDAGRRAHRGFHEPARHAGGPCQGHLAVQLRDRCLA